MAARIGPADLRRGRRYRFIANTTTNTDWQAEYEGTLLGLRRAGATIILSAHGREVEIPTAAVLAAEEVTE